MYRLFPFVNLFYLSAPEPASGRGTVERSETGRGPGLRCPERSRPEWTGLVTDFDQQKKLELPSFTTVLNLTAFNQAW